MLTRYRQVKQKIMAYAKEATLIFLALFYFVIATNTQTGWLFVLSAFLLGLLGLSLVTSRRAAQGLELVQSFYGDPQKDQPMRLKSVLTNSGTKTVQEARVEADCPHWAEEAPAFAWAVPNLPAGKSATCEHRIVPHKRGEHVLEPARIVCGAPFGLFENVKVVKNETTFLVYPAVERLPTTKTRSRLATALGELTSPRGRGDSHSLRSVREYRSGDDLRQVHWKASAKRGPNSALLIKEHHAPTPARLSLALDCSATELDDELFERGVTLASSVLWSAQRDGLQTNLWLFIDRQWCSFRRWPEQYTALAKIKRQKECDLAQLAEQANLTMEQLVTITTADNVAKTEGLPCRQVFVLADPARHELAPSSAKILIIDGTSPGFEVLA